MLIVISPAKTLDENILKNNFLDKYITYPIFLKQSLTLVSLLNTLTIDEITKLMGITKKIAQINKERYSNFSSNPAKPAILMFKGDVYKNIEVTGYHEEDFIFAQNHLRILSGLYGLLKPLDLIKPHRLEMDTAINNLKGKTLYDFWGNLITEELNKADDEYLINLASEEYFKAINKNLINKKIIDIKFLQNDNRILKNIGIHSKKARGMMANFIIKNKLSNPNDLKKFNQEGYFFNKENSSSTCFIFVR